MKRRRASTAAVVALVIASCQGLHTPHLLHHASRITLRATVEHKQEGAEPPERDNRARPPILELTQAMQLVKRGTKHESPRRRNSAGGQTQAPSQRRRRSPQAASAQPSSAPSPNSKPPAAARRYKRAAPPSKSPGEQRLKSKKSYDAPRRREPEQFRGARGSLKKKKNRLMAPTKEKEDDDAPPIILPDAPISVAALADKLGKSGGEVVKILMLKLGVLASITQSVDGATARKVAEEVGRRWLAQQDEHQASPDPGGETALDTGAVLEYDEPSQLEARAPVVTIMGHVDHGKTSLLDAIRESKVAAGEAGGITQGIGAYAVELHGGRSITFIDTPGHAAFTEMRARGANVTDIVVLVVAADDGVKAQTVDSIVCAKRAGVPMVVAVNKMDAEGADVTKVDSELMSYDLVPEEYGGDTLFARVSAKTRENLDDLLEKIWLQAELLELRANPNAPLASGIVVEAGVDKGLGVVATTLVRRGTVRIGDCFVAGSAYGKVRALFDDVGRPADAAPPSTAVRVVGWQSGADRAPAAGDTFNVAADEQTARKVADARHAIAAEQRATRLRDATQRQFSRFVTSVEGEAPKEERLFQVLIKADCAGSVEALETSLANLDVEDDVSRVRAQVVFSGVGEVTKSDVAIASVSSAFVVAFNVGANAAALEEERRLAGVVRTRYYAVVYDVLDDVTDKMQAILSPTPDGEHVGTARVKQLFDIGKIGKVAGCGVASGYLKKNANFRVMRGDFIKFQGKLRTLRNVKTDVDRIDAGNDCGLSFQDWEEFEVDDLIECYDPSV